jgi:1-pyrroline-5-carboxylate dehydrogenase
MSSLYSAIPQPVNEPINSYAPGTPERRKLRAALEEMKNQTLEIPCIIGGKEFRTNDVITCTSPEDHSMVLAQYHQAGENEINLAIESAMAARKGWMDMAWQDRAAIFLKAADLIATKYRYKINAATMLGQGKNPMQAEIDAACELIDFLRFNVFFMSQIYQEQPQTTPLSGLWNRSEYRGLEGFVFAVTPFNFTAIGGNLSTAPAIMGNVVVWKPASTAVLSGYIIMQILKEAGLPDGVINYVPSKGSVIGKQVFSNPNFTGLHFTGSTGTFNTMWREIGANLEKYKTYPRIVGETGGKDFIFGLPDYQEEEFVTSMVRGAFEYQGQKCSAASRAYIPQSRWAVTREKLVAQVNSLKVGSVLDFSNFVNPVIDKSAFKDITGYIEWAKQSDECEIIAGGTYDDSKGWFIDPTVIVTTNPHAKTMEKEIFGPVFTIYVYDDSTEEKVVEALELCNQTSEYALTGAIWGTDRSQISMAAKLLKEAAGNFYINDKPTGAVVGQQPFGGARKSGTNDKAGSIYNLIRWTSVQSVKENFIPPTDYRYSYMERDESEAVFASSGVTLSV